MRILAVDTATKSCSVAIADENALVAEATILSGETHSMHLMDMIDQVFRMADVHLKDLDGVAVTKGPGSFTGLRIGVSTVKGIAAASGKPLVGVSTLHALASQAGNCSHLICPIMDARKNEDYFSQYRFQNGVLKKDAESRAAPIESAIEGIREPCLFIGDGAVFYRGTILDTLGDIAGFAPAYQHTIRASTVAHLGMMRLTREETDDMETFVPYYIRKSDAELKLDKPRRP